MASGGGTVSTGLPITGTGESPAEPSVAGSTVAVGRRLRVPVMTFLGAEVLPHESQLPPPPPPLRRLLELFVLCLRVRGLVVSVCALMSAPTE